MSYLLDSNVLIYAARPEPLYYPLRQWVKRSDATVSALSQVEVLGFHALAVEDETYLRLALARLPSSPITKAVLEHATSVRQQFRLKTADAIVAATALVHGLTLVTADKDFKRVSGLPLINPLLS